MYLTTEEFDVIKVGDILTNKISDRGYDYKVIDKTPDKIKVEELSMCGEYIINRYEIEDCSHLKKEVKL